MKKVDIFNILVLVTICLILLITFYFQFFTDERTPCALSYLQRAFLILYACGLVLCVRTNRLTGYFIAFIAALFGLISSSLQSLLEMPPGMPQAGSTVLNLHLYYWCVFIFLILMIYTFIILSLREHSKYKQANKAISFVELFLGAIILINAISAYMNYGTKFFGYGTYKYYVLCKSEGHTDRYCSRPNPEDLIKEYKSNLKKVLTQPTNNPLIKITQEVCSSEKNN